MLFKDGQIDRERFPSFAALGGDSAVFTNATSNYGMTALSIPSFLTGRWLPPEDFQGNLCLQSTGPCADSVLRALAANGYVVEFFEIRPDWQDASIIRHHPYAKIRFVKNQQVWKLYWRRASEKYESYRPFPESA
ncbi:MAG: DUF3024 domain-containing protein, partial [Dehalococcoidia bacterium]|nr:DUF3024 domain-containing protein [Dehalococcoidia bacterium]